MNFFSLDFVAIFVAFLVIYWLFQPKRAIQNYLLIIASYYFVYQFNALSAYVLAGYTACIYLIANVLLGKVSAKKQYGLLILVLLAFFTAFKYYNFLQETLSTSFSNYGLDFSLPVFDILPIIGLSFFIFHSVSYVVSVAKKEIAPAPLPDLILYICFFPSIVAGPINRAVLFLPQIQNTRQLLDVRKALLLIALAILKLFLLSSYLSSNFASPVFSAASTYSQVQNINAVYAYAWNIYFNFSGYTNLVMGIALLLGFKVPHNFYAPYLARNLQEFWRDWHVSLSQFIRDYIYIPLGGDCRKIPSKGYRFIMKNINILAAMVLSGLWHGAALTFIIWGFIHGLGVVLFNVKYLLRNTLIFRLLGYIPQSVRAIFARIITFHFVCFSWIFFRSASFHDATVMIKQIFIPSQIGIDAAQWGIFAIFWIFFFAYPLFVYCYKLVAQYYMKVNWVFYPIILSLFLTVVFTLSPSGIPGFIYAHF